MYLTKTSLSLLLAIALVLTSVVSVQAEFNAPLAEGLIKIEDSRLVYQGKSVKVPFTRERLIAVFGKPSREIYNTAGTVVIWDDLGLTCYGCQARVKKPEELEFMTNEEKKHISYQPYIDSITLFVRKYNPYPERENKYSHEPRYPFQGRIELDGVELDGTLTFYEWMENRKGNNTILLPENSFSFYIRCKPEPNEVTLHTIRDKYDEDFMSVYSVSIRNIGHYYKYLPCTEQFSVAPRPEQSGPEATDKETSSKASEKEKPETEKPAAAVPDADKPAESEKDKPEVNKSTPSETNQPVSGSDKVPVPVAEDL